jgi:hypothetical protein
MTLPFDCFGRTSVSMMLFRRVLLVSLMAFGAILRNRADTTNTVTLSAAANATIISDDSANPLGDLSILSGTRGRNANGLLDRGLLRFDFSSIPTNAQIQTVTLQLVVTMAPQTPVTSNFELYRMLKAWDETATWETAKAGVSWGQPGTQEGIDRAADASVSEEIDGTGEYDFGPSDGLKGDVSSWIANPAGNNGWLLKSDLESAFSTARHFGSRASDNPPQLVVQYSVAATNPAPELKDVRARTNKFLFEFDAAAGSSYRVDARTNLSTGTWTVLTNVPAVSTNAPIVLTNAIEGRQKFFRLVVQ